MQQEVFYHLPILLSGAAGVSKTLWAQSAGTTRGERKTLRDHFKQTDTSPFAPQGLIGRKMRNNFEHFDTELDKWWKRGKTNTYYERMVFNGEIHFLGLDDPDPAKEWGPPFHTPRYFSNIPNEPLNMFRSYNIAMKRIMFLGETLDKDLVVAEAKVLLAIPRPH